MLLGHSLGVQVVAELLSTEPADVRCAVLLTPTTDDAARNRFSQARRLAWDTSGEPLNLKFVQLFAAAACRARVWWWTSRFMLDEHIEDALEQVRVPLLIVRGDRDRLASAAWPQRLSAACLESAVAEVPGAGHVVHWSHPAEVARLRWWWGTRELATMAVGESSP
ncbi:lysophospholipase [Kineococcus sp. NBC_00420]|uniref:alpha/beta fold hydrolase n=1 Tax=Kineococcus sp. NBC_00420 TaxID=2903564 RepID=UPI002E1E82FD